MLLLSDRDTESKLRLVGQTGTLLEKELTLEEGQITRVDLRQGPGAPAALVLDTDKKARTRAWIVHQGGQNALALKDPASGIGYHAFPVRLGDDANTRLLVYNPSLEEAHFSGFLSFSSGAQWTLPRGSVAANSFIEFDLKQLHQETAVDHFGRVIPDGEVKGQIKFLQKGKVEEKLLVQAVIDLSSGQTLQLESCPLCASQPTEIDFVPGTTLSGLVGQNLSLPPVIAYYSDGSSEDATLFSTLTSNNTSVAQVHLFGADIVGAGSTSIEAAYENPFVEIEPICLLLAGAVITTIIVAGEEPPSVVITGPSPINVGELVQLNTSTTPSGGALSNWRIVNGDAACVDLRTNGAVKGYAPGSLDFRVDYNVNSQTATSNLSNTVFQPVPQYINVKYTSEADNTEVTQIKNRVLADLATLLVQRAGANVVFGSPPQGIAMVITLEVRGNSPGTQGGEAGVDIMNRSRSGFGWVFIGSGSLDLLNMKDPVTSTATIRERRQKDRVADAISRLAAHEIGHMLGLVPLSGEISPDQLAAKLMAAGLGLNGTATHHNPTSNDVNIMQFVANLGSARTWNISLYNFSGKERAYLDRILP